MVRELEEGHQLWAPGAPLSLSGFTWGGAVACVCEPPEWPQSGVCTLDSGGNRAPVPFALCRFQTPLRPP